MTSPTRHVALLVVGGGIGGLAVANALAAHGRTVHLIEKEAEFGEIGAGIQLAPNASWALDRLGVLDDIATHAVFPQRILWMDAASGERLTSLPLGDTFVGRYGYRYLVMHRSDLLAVLLAHARRNPLITLETSKAVAGVDSADDAVTIACADGSTYVADVAIAADGLRSVLRKSVIDDGDPICSHYVAYRGTLPIEDVSSHAGLDNVMLWTDTDLHLVQYPVRRGELYNQVAVFKSKRYRPDTQDWGTPDELDAMFAATAEPVRSALGRFWRDRRWPMYDRLPIAPWTSGRVVLLGDAAHPMLQYLAQGAAQALEDAVVLGDAFAAHESFDDAMAAYQNARIERTARVQRDARRWGDYWHLPIGPERDARDAYLRGRAEDDQSEIAWLYAHFAGASLTGPAVSP